MTRRAAITCCLRAALERTHTPTKIRNRANQEVITAVTVSAGVAACVKGDDAYGLIGAADAALYRSKQAGRDRVCVA